MPNPFISTQDLSDYIGRDVTTDNGAIMAVDAACDTIRNLTDQDFNPDSSQTTVTLDGHGGDALVLPLSPVTSTGVSAGTVLVDGGTVTDYMISDSGLLIRGTVGERCWGWSPKWPMGRQNVKVTYDHGYATINVPRDIRMVALSLAARLVLQGVAQSETVGDVSVTYGQAASELNATEKLILQQYQHTRSF